MLGENDTGKIDSCNKFINNLTDFYDIYINGFKWECLGQV